MKPHKPHKHKWRNMYYEEGKGEMYQCLICGEKKHEEFILMPESVYELCKDQEFIKKFLVRKLHKIYGYHVNPCSYCILTCKSNVWGYCKEHGWYPTVGKKCSVCFKRAVEVVVL